MSTNVVSARSIKREVVEFDAKNKVLGRLASEIAQVLIGKTKSNYVPYLDMGDFVVVTNAALVKVTGNKENVKRYVRHSGYPGGYRDEVLATVRATKPEQIITHAVKGMLPKTKLGRQMIKKLTVYAAAKPRKTAKVESVEETPMTEGVSA
jgi:large subunit ribosomal protein L13